jgi:hypothetical protein
MTSLAESSEEDYGSKKGCFPDDDDEKHFILILSFVI